MRNPHSIFRRAAPFLAALLALLFFYRLAFTDSILARGDTFAYFYPYWFARSEAFLSGRLPLWSPDLFMGVPLLANSQIGVFYPLNWPLTGLTPPDAVRVSILFHIGWALAGTYLLARRVLRVGFGGALVAAALFALGGHVGAHVEQINQLQGLSWMPWLFLLLDRALERPLVYTPLLAMGLALQFFSGHTQTVFITGLGLGVYGLLSGKLRFIPILIGAAVGAALLALPQLAPTLELTGVSNRRGGFNQNQATAFSFSPFVLGRGLLPSYDGALFGEYVAYGGVIGFGLALLGLTTRPAVTQSVTGSPLRLRRWLARWRAGYSPRVVWAVIAAVGLLLALGLYNPVYWLLAALPGFNLFRVPARWLALFALGVALLAGLGFDALSRGRLPNLRLRSGLIAAVIALLAGASLLATRIPEGVPMPAPTVISFAGWAVALVVLLSLLALASRRSLRQGAALLLATAALAELLIAARVLPFNDLTPPDVYAEQRFTTSQLLAYETEPAPGRMLSISGLFFDPGDRAALETRYSKLSAAGLRNALVAIKMKETMAANLPLIYHIPTIDGFDGGLLPTSYYTAFTALMLPTGTLRTLDGRLRERLALPDCNGACIPDPRWLDLTNTRYLVTDKVYDLVHDGIFYDTQFTVPLDAGATAAIRSVPAFESTAIDVLYRCASGDSCAAPTALLDDASVTGAPVNALGGDQLARLTLASPLTPRAVTIRAADAVQLRAVTLVDTRTGDFQQLTLGPWRRILSSDIKLYENLDVLPRVFVAAQRVAVMDDDYGTEYALAQMRDPTYDPARTAILSGLPKTEQATATARGRAAITAYAPERVEVQVDAPDGGTLVLADAYYPGWTATVDGAAAPLYRADVMFRGVPLAAGKQTVVFEYRPVWLPGALMIGALAWLLAAALVIVAYGLRRTRRARAKA